MRTNTAEFEFSHGRKPRGFGNWALEVTGTDGQGRYTTEQYFGQGTLAEVKKDVCRRFKDEVGEVKAIVEVTVLP